MDFWKPSLVAVWCLFCSRVLAYDLYLTSFPFIQRWLLLLDGYTTESKWLKLIALKMLVGESYFRNMTQLTFIVNVNVNKASSIRLDAELLCCTYGRKLLCKPYTNESGELNQLVHAVRSASMPPSHSSFLGSYVTTNWITSWEGAFSAFSQLLNNSFTASPN